MKKVKRNDMKYIDADLLRKEIEKERKSIGGLFIEGDNSFYRTRDAYNHTLALIDSLQQEQPNCHTVEDWMQHIKNADQLTKDIFSKGPYDVLYDAINHPYQHCYDAIKEFGELCFQTGAKSIKQEQQEMDLDSEIEEYWIATEWSKVITLGKFKVIARYFYGLGQLNSK